MTCFPSLSFFRARRILWNYVELYSKDNTFVRVHRVVKLDIVGRKSNLTMAVPSPTTCALLPQVKILFQMKFFFKSMITRFWNVE
jgi:hypothetical protein